MSRNTFIFCIYKKEPKLIFDMPLILTHCWNIILLFLLIIAHIHKSHYPSDLLFPLALFLFVAPGLTSFSMTRPWQKLLRSAKLIWNVGRDTFVTCFTGYEIKGTNFQQWVKKSIENMHKKYSVRWSVGVSHKRFVNARGRWGWFTTRMSMQLPFLLKYIYVRGWDNTNALLRLSREGGREIFVRHAQRGREGGANVLHYVIYERSGTQLKSPCDFVNFRQKYFLRCFSRFLIYSWQSK